MSNGMIKKDAPIVSNEKLTKGQQKKKKLDGDSEKITCVKHGGRALSLKNNNFYKANSGSVFAGLGHIPICSSCVKEMFLKYYYDNNSDYIKATYYTCRRMDIVFNMSTCEGAFKKAKGKPEVIIGYYIGNLNSLNTKISCFDDSEFIEEGKEGLDMKIKKLHDNYQLDESQMQHGEDIIRKLGYDPFAGSGYDDFQLGQLYTELVSYLEDDELMNDSYKLGVVMDMINDSHQIRQIDLYISMLNSGLGGFKDNASLISTLMTQKKGLADSKNKRYEKNKWLAVDTTGRSKLAGMMKKYREYGFDEIDVNYFDILTSEAVKTVVDLSHKSIITMLDWSSEEEKEVFTIQRQLIDSKDGEIAKLNEEKLQLARELVDLKRQVRDEKEGA